MVTLEQIERGAARYLDSEIAPQIPTNIPNGQIKKIAIIAGATYALKHRLRDLLVNPLLTTMGVVDEEGNIDLEGFAEVFKEQIPDKGFKVTLPILGDPTFFDEDVDKLVSYITQEE